jgi:hypothetical protein
MLFREEANRMTVMVRALKAEVLKMKRTLALWLAFAAPLVVVVFILVGYLDRGEEWLGTGLENVWVEFAHSVDIFWALLMLPLFITLQTALLAGLEHQSEQWKHLYALPIPRWAVVVAKQAAAAALMGLSHLILICFTLLGGWLLWLLRPGLGFHVAIPWGRLLRPVATVYLASWLILAIHTWVALRWRSFVVASAAGIVPTVLGVIVVNSEWGSFYPWALAGLIVNGLNKGESLPLLEFLLGSLGGLVAALVGGWEITRRESL